MLNPIVGLMNSGKTLEMTRRGFIAVCNGKTVITNYDVNFPHVKINKDYMIQLGRTQPVLKNVCFCLDEFWIWFDARTFHKNTVVSYFFNQSSKDDTEIYMTAQHNGQLPLRIRNNLQSLSQCNRVLIINKRIMRLSEEKRFIPKKLQPYLYIKVTDFKRITLGGETDMIPTQPFYVKAELFFKLYDTRQKIKAMS